MLYGSVSKVETQNLASPDFNFCILNCGVSKVETQNLASHKQKCVYIHGVFATLMLRQAARETQDFASLQADAIVIP